jgi:hypothetical protein
MATKKQRQAARENIRKAQETWQSMSPRERARAQPEGRQRRKPGMGGEGDYYRVVVRSKDDFVTFRTHDVGEPGHIQRIAGKRTSGSWDTTTWLISKSDAHVDGKTLVGNTAEVTDLLEQLGSEPTHMKGDIFEARPRRNVPEHEKPTAAQKRARRSNIKKAQQARKASRR